MRNVFPISAASRLVTALRADEDAAVVFLESIGFKDLTLSANSENQISYKFGTYNEKKLMALMGEYRTTVKGYKQWKYNNDGYVFVKNKTVILKTSKTVLPDVKKSGKAPVLKPKKGSGPIQTEDQFPTPKDNEPDNKPNPKQPNRPHPLPKGGTKGPAIPQPGQKPVKNAPPAEEEEEDEAPPAKPLKPPKAEKPTKPDVPMRPAPKPAAEKPKPADDRSEDEEDEEEVAEATEALGFEDKGGGVHVLNCGGGLRIGAKATGHGQVKIVVKRGSEIVESEQASIGPQMMRMLKKLVEKYKAMGDEGEGEGAPKDKPASKPDVPMRPAPKPDVPMRPAPQKPVGPSPSMDFDTSKVPGKILDGEVYTINSVRGKFHGMCAGKIPGRLNDYAIIPLRSIEQNSRSYSVVNPEKILPFEGTPEEKATLQSSSARAKANEVRRAYSLQPLASKGEHAPVAPANDTPLSPTKIQPSNPGVTPPKSEGETPQAPASRPQPQPHLVKQVTESILKSLGFSVQDEDGDVTDYMAYLGGGVYVHASLEASRNVLRLLTRDRTGTSGAYHVDAASPDLMGLVKKYLAEQKKGRQPEPLEPSKPLDQAEPLTPVPDDKPLAPSTDKPLAPRPSGSDRPLGPTRPPKVHPPVAPAGDTPLAPRQGDAPLAPRGPRAGEHPDDDLGEGYVEVPPKLAADFNEVKVSKHGGQAFLVNLWRYLNTSKFGGQLMTPQQLGLKKDMGIKTRGLGHWAPGKRQLMVSPRLFNGPLNDFAATLLHEMCHQAVTDIDRKWETEEGGHGPVWQAWMHKVGLTPNRYAAPGAIDRYMSDAEKERQAQQIARKKPLETITKGMLATCELSPGKFIGVRICCSQPRSPNIIAFIQPRSVTGTKTMFKNVDKKHLFQWMGTAAERAALTSPMADHKVDIVFNHFYRTRTSGPQYR